MNVESRKPPQRSSLQLRMTWTVNRSTQSKWIHFQMEPFHLCWNQGTSFGGKFHLGKDEKNEWPHINQFQRQTEWDKTNEIIHVVHYLQSHSAVWSKYTDTGNENKCIIYNKITYKTGHWPRTHVNPNKVRKKFEMTKRNEQKENHTYLLSVQVYNH